MTTPTDTERLAQALREVLRTGLNGGNNVRLALIAASAKELDDADLKRADESEAAVKAAREALAAHESRAQPASVADVAAAKRAIEARNHYLHEHPGDAVDAMVAALQAAAPQPTTPHCHECRDTGWLPGAYGGPCWHCARGKEARAALAPQPTAKGGRVMDAKRRRRGWRWWVSLIPVVAVLIVFHSISAASGLLSDGLEWLAHRCWRVHYKLFEGARRFTRNAHFWVWGSSAKEQTNDR